MRRCFENQLLDSMQCDGQDCNMKKKIQRKISSFFKAPFFAEEENKKEKNV